MNIKGLLLDLDGTLLDTKQDLCDCFNKASSVHGYPPLSPDDYIKCVGWGTEKMVRMALPAGAPEDIVVSVLAAHLENYNKGLLNKTRPYEGFHEVLRALSADGYSLAVLSNKPDGQTRTLIETLLWDIPFKAIVGQREGRPAKPDPEVPLEIAAIMGLAPAEIAFVGDSDVDMETARNAGMYPLGVTWGYRDRALILQSGAQSLADKPEDLLQLLQRQSG